MPFTKLKPPTDTELRFFAVLQILFFTFLLVVFREHAFLEMLFRCLLVISGIIGIVGLFRPALIRPFHRYWMMLVLPIGWVISHLLMAIVYYFVLTPIGFWRKKKSGDPLRREFDKSVASYWEERVPSKTTESYFRQF